MALTLAATPLGNPLDASPRLVAAIESAEIIAAEDSRRFHRLASDIKATFTARILSFFEDNETDRTQELLTQLREGRNVLVVSDAGMPTISDPGFRLMRDAIAEGIEVGVHSMTHPNLCQCSQEQLNQEIVESKVRLESTLGTSGLDTFCYPYGHHHPGLYPLLKRAGYRGAVAVFSRERTVTVNPYAMRRIHPHPGDSALRFRLKLSASYLKWVAYRDRNRQTTA